VRTPGFSSFALYDDANGEVVQIRLVESDFLVQVRQADRF
jgi:hypothetical protein